MQRIPQHTTDLRIDAETDRGEVVAFLDSRLREPAVLGDDVDGVVVWNFNSHDIDARALLAADLDSGRYVVPYQVPGVWGFMAKVLPDVVADATLLTYRQKQGVYAAYPNLRAVDDGGWRYSEERSSLTDALLEGLGGTGHD